MTRKLKLKGQIALVTSILLLALWDPTITYAQPNAEHESGKYANTADVHECVHCKMLHSVKGRPCRHAHQHSISGITDIESMIGFVEVDPAAGLFENLEFGAVSSSPMVGGDYVGFAEADLTDSGALDTLITTRFLERSAWQTPVGFAETDLANFEGSFEAIPNEILAECQHMGT